MLERLKSWVHEVWHGDEEQFDAPDIDRGAGYVIEEGCEDRSKPGIRLIGFEKRWPQ